MKNSFWLLLIFVLGGIGGMIGSLWLAPILADISPFSKIGWLANSKDGVTIINKTERVYISEDKAFVEGLDKLKPSMVGVQSFVSGKLVSEGNGFILTSDGLVVTSSLLVPPKASVKVLINNQVNEASVLKSEQNSGLALLKISQTNLTPVALAQVADIYQGQSLFLSFLGLESETSGFILNRGYIEQVSDQEISAKFYSERPVATGGAVIDERGNVVGLANVNQAGEISLILGHDIINILSQ